MLRTAKVLLILLFAFTSSVLLFYLTNRNSGYSRKFVKTEFKKTGIYEEYINDWEERAKKVFTDGKAKKEDLKIIDQFFEEFNKDYVEAKSDQVIDDSILFISGQSDIEPVISFIDLKEKLIKKNPEFGEMLDELTATKMDVNPDSQLSSYEKNRDDMELEENRLAKLFKEDPVIKLTGLTGVRQIYSNYKIGFYVVIVLTALWIGLLALITGPKSNKFRWVGTAFGIGLLWNGLIFGLVWYVQKADPIPRIFAAILGLDLGNIRSKEFGMKTVDLAHNLAAPWFSSFYKVQTIGIILLLILTIIFLVLAMSSKTSTLTPPVKKHK